MIVIFWNRSGVRLHGCNERVTDLVVCDGLLFLVGKHRVLLLVACDDDLDGLFKARLRHDRAVIAHCAKGSLVDHIRQLCTRSAGGHTRDGVEVHIVCGLDLLRVNLENCFAAGKIRKLDGHAAVKASRAGQSRIQRLWAGSSQRG